MRGTMGGVTLMGVGLGLLALGCSQPKATGEAGPGVAQAGEAKAASAGAIDFDDPSTCEDCHEAVVKEWRESMHARAHHSRDPIYAGVRAIRMNKEGADIAKACASCHTPRYEDAPDDPKAVVGVGCASCHNALVHAPAMALLGPHDLPAGASDAHATGPAPDLMKDGSKLCLVCHAEMKSKTGVPICTTGPEHAEGASGKTCVSCHMPRVAGPAGEANDARKDHASHAFGGPHRAWYQDDPSVLADGLDLKAAFAGDKLTITLVNQTAHGFPTGFPGRMMAVACKGFDAAGAETWACPPTRLMKVYHDAEGKPTLAPYAAKLASDTRLKPGETRTLSFDVPAAVKKVVVQGVARLVPPPLAAKLKLEGQLEAQPRVFEKVEVTR